MQNTDNAKCWLGNGTQERTLTLLVGMQNGRAILEYNFTGSLKVKHSLTIFLTVTLLGIYPNN